MSLDGFLTALSLIVAIFAIVSPAARMKLKLHWKLQVLAGLFSFVLVLYFEFFGVFGQQCWQIMSTYCGWFLFPADQSFTPENAAFFVVICWLVFAYFIFQYSRISSLSLPAFRRLADRLIFEKRYSEFWDLVQPNLNLVEIAANRHTPFFKFRSFLFPEKRSVFEALGALNETENGHETRPNIVQRVWCLVRDKIQIFDSWVVKGDKTETAAKSILNILFRSKELMGYIVSFRPYASIAILKIDSHQRFEFSDEILRKMMSDSGSVLFEELKTIQTLDQNEGYSIGGGSEFLTFYFSDMSVAKKFGVWKPVGDHLLRRLRDDVETEYSLSLRRRPDFFEGEKWSDPIYVGLQFFDLMVRRAAFQDINWHMWLYYTPLLVDRLERHFDTSGPGINEEDEFPILAAELIYECIDRLGSWIEMVKVLPDASIHRNIEPQFYGDNGNIPVSAARALGQSFRTIAMSERVGDKFAGYIFECILRDINGLGRESTEGLLRSYLIVSILDGGGRDLDYQYGSRLARLVRGVDQYLIYDLDDFIRAANERYPQMFD